MARAHRKDEHIIYSISNAPERANFSDLPFVHNCLSDKNFKQVLFSSQLGGANFPFAFFLLMLLPGY